ncbi:MAG: nucleotidyltransferase family protein [Desulfuromusa sp.]
MLQLNAVIMAAGQSRRFGSNKLLLSLQGKPVIQHLLDQFPFNLFHQVVLVYSHEPVRLIAQKYPLILCHNDHPSQGKGGTIRLGLETCDDGEGTLFLVGDQPLLRRATIITLTKKFLNHPKNIVMPVIGKTPCNPVFFPEACLPELKTLQGDVGGKVVIQKHADLIVRVPFDDANEFVDIDAPETYEKLIKVCCDEQISRKSQ